MPRRNIRETDFFGKQAKQQLSELVEERDAVNRMMDHMAAGLILLDLSLIHIFPGTSSPSLFCAATYWSSGI